MVEGIAMKTLFLILIMISFSALAQDPTAYLNNFDARVYSLKNKGVKDFVVDIESSKLTDQLNDQMIFGKVEEVIFRTYWTANPERIAIEVIGLPDGFKEIKEELKISIMSVIESLLPPTTIQRFAGYKFQGSKMPKEFIAQDGTGIANVQSYVLRFDNQDKLIEIVGNRPIGTLSTTPVYEKEGFSDGKWVLKSIATVSSENGQSYTLKKELSYGSSQGMGVLSKVKVSSEQKGANSGAKSSKLEEVVEFKNYKINAGIALKYFLGETEKTSP